MVLIIIKIYKSLLKHTIIHCIFVFLKIAVHFKKTFNVLLYIKFICTVDNCYFHEISFCM